MALPPAPRGASPPADTWTAAQRHRFQASGLQKEETHCYCPEPPAPWQSVRQPWETIQCGFSGNPTCQWVGAPPMLEGTRRRHSAPWCAHHAGRAEQVWSKPLCGHHVMPPGYSMAWPLSPPAWDRPSHPELSGPVHSPAGSTPTSPPSGVFLKLRLGTNCCQENGCREHLT